MSKQLIHRQSGLSLIEMVVSIALAGFMMIAITKLTAKAISLRNMGSTLDQSPKIGTAMETTYRENILYASANCYGWTEGNCTGITILPTRTNSTTLTLTTYSPAVVKAWQDAGCTVTAGTAPAYTVSCKDGYRNDVSFSTITNGHTTNSLYLNAYNKTPYSITFTLGGSKNITYAWGSGYLDSEYTETNAVKRQQLINAISSYHIARLTYEAVVNTPNATTGGLTTSDDIIVPWIWEALGAAPSLSCSGIESGNAGCTSLAAANWLTDTAYLTLNTKAEIQLLLGNIGVGNTYEIDAFGNPITIRLFTDSSGGALAAVPPRPRPGYFDCLPGGTAANCSGLTFSVLPPYRGAIGVLNSGAWVQKDTIVYAQ